MKQPTLLLGITGGISAYKLTDLASRLTKEGIRVLTVMTDSAQQFITPLTMETLTKQRCYTQLFDRQTPEEVTHIWLAQQADVVLVAPATANFLAKMTYGLADDLLSSVLLATTAPVLVSPAMNVHMYRNPATQQNLAALQQRGVQIIPPEEGLLACGETGEGRLPETETLYRWVKKALTPQDLAGKKILVTAGATREAVDPVRFLTNHSTGKMGYAVAQAALAAGSGSYPGQRHHRPELSRGGQSDSRHLRRRHDGSGAAALAGAGRLRPFRSGGGLYPGTPRRSENQKGGPVPAHPFPDGHPGYPGLAGGT